MKQQTKIKTTLTNKEIINLQKLRKAIDSQFTPEFDKVLMRQQYNELLFSVKPEPEEKPAEPATENQNNDTDSTVNDATVVSENDSKKGKASK